MGCRFLNWKSADSYAVVYNEQAVRERLRDGYRDAEAKAGAKRGDQRRSLDVPTWFAPLLRWVVALHPPDCRQLALVLDASPPGQRFTVLSIHVLIRGCAIPVAWHSVRATAKGAWQPPWEVLFHQLHGSVPDDWTVIVATDRGRWGLVQPACVDRMQLQRYEPGRVALGTDQDDQPAPGRTALVGDGACHAMGRQRRVSRRGDPTSHHLDRAARNA